LELHQYVVRLVKLAKRDQSVVSTAMILVHKFLAARSLGTMQDDLKRIDRLIFASAAVFLASKIRNQSYYLSDAVICFFEVAQELEPKYRELGLSE
jgi:hypothetical protein